MVHAAEATVANRLYEDVKFLSDIRGPDSPLMDPSLLRAFSLAAVRYRVLRTNSPLTYGDPTLWLTTSPVTTFFSENISTAHPGLNIYAQASPLIHALSQIGDQQRMSFNISPFIPSFNPLTWSAQFIRWDLHRGGASFRNLDETAICSTAAECSCIVVRLASDCMF